MAKIYVASSWRNQHQPQVVSFLREQGHEVYDFSHPAGKTGFQWSQIDKNWENWSTDQYRVALDHPIAQAVSNRILMQCNGLMFVFLYCLVDVLRIQRQDG